MINTHNDRIAQASTLVRGSVPLSGRMKSLCKVSATLSGKSRSESDVMLKVWAMLLPSPALQKLFVTRLSIKRLSR